MVKLRPAAENRRAAAMPAAPAPTMTTSKSTDGEGLPSAGAATLAVEAARKVRRLKRFMVGDLLPALAQRHPRNLPQQRLHRKYDA